MHPLLERQIRRIFGDSVTPVAGLDQLFELVSQAYESNDEELQLVERALDLSSEELLDTNSKLQAIVQALPDVLLRYDAAGILKSIHAGNETDLYKPASELLGTSIYTIPIRSVRQQFVSAFKKTLKTRSLVRFEYNFALEESDTSNNLSPREEFYEARFVPIPDGGALCILRNLTLLNHTIASFNQRSQDYKRLFNNARDPILVIDLNTRRILDANAQASKTYKYRLERLVGMSFSKILADTNDLERLWDCIGDEPSKSLESLHRTSTGSTRIIEMLGSLVNYQDRDAILCICRDVTQETVNKTELSNYISLLKATLNSTADGILVMDRQGNIVTFNQLFCKMWSIPAELLENNESQKALAIARSQLKNPDRFMADISRIVADENTEHHDLLEFKDGRIFERTSVPQRIKNETVGRVWSFRDITDRKRAEDSIKHHAYHDNLTGLPNRLRFRECLRRSMFKANREGNSLALLFIDLDRFKTINDNLGHATGDRLLEIVAKRLDHRRREGDTVARLGGDEFLIIASDLESPEAAQKFADRIQEILDPPVTIDGREFHASASIGIALYPDHAEDPSNLMKFADVAMYQAKAQGGRTAVLFEPSMTTGAEAKLKLEDDVRRAIKYKKFEVFYQPQVRLKDGHLIGAEALLRLKDSAGNYWRTDHVIETAEHCGLINDIGSWILEHTTNKWKEWSGLFPVPLKLAVNVSARQLSRKDFKDEVLHILEKSKIPPGNLTLELTESVVMENPEQAVKDLSSIRELGVGIAIDDFGTGHSSLSYLARLPMTTLKIDRSFVHNCHSEPNKNAIVSTILSMGLHLDLNVVAEGIETEDEYRFLANRDCHTGQGYFIERPLNEDAFELLLKQQAQTTKKAERKKNAS